MKTTEDEYDEPLMAHSPEVLERLQKLLKLGQRSESEGEVKAAMAAAKKIAIKHKIDLAKVKVVDIDPVTKEPFTARIFAYGTDVYRPMDIKYIVWLLQEHFNVRVVYTYRYNKERANAGMKHRTDHCIELFGRHSDTEFASYAYDYLRETFPKVWRKEKRKNGFEMDARRSFYYGMYVGINQALETAKEETEAEEFLALSENERKEVSSRYALMVVGEKEELDKEFKDRHLVLGKKKEKTGNIWDPAARSAGRQAGLKVKINRPLDDNKKSALE